MPEAAIDEDGDPGAGEGDVDSSAPVSWIGWEVHAISQSGRVEALSDRDLR